MFFTSTGFTPDKKQVEPQKQASIIATQTAANKGSLNHSVPTFGTELFFLLSFGGECGNMLQKEG